MICETSNRNTNDLQGISNLLAYDLNLHFIAHEHACDSSTVVVTIYKELTIWKASECFPQDLGSDSRQTTCGLRPKTTTTQFSSTAKQPNVINQADTARNKEKPLNSVLSSNLWGGCQGREGWRRRHRRGLSEQLTLANSAGRFSCF